MLDSFSPAGDVDVLGVLLLLQVDARPRPWYRVCEDALTKVGRSAILLFLISRQTGKGGSCPLLWALRLACCRSDSAGKRLCYTALRCFKLAYYAIRHGPQL